MNKSVGKVLTLLLALSAFAHARQEESSRYVVEDVAAVVGEEIVLSSEIKMAILRAIQERKLDMKDSVEMKRLSSEVLDAQISQKILVHHAKEANVEISDEEVSEMVDNQINELRKNYRNEEEFRRDLASAGQTMLSLREMYRAQARNDLLQQKYLQEHTHDFPRVKVNEEEARTFFDEQVTATRPEQIKFLHMLIEPTPSEEALAIAKTRIDSIYKLYLDGADFAYLAERHSDGPSAKDGGNLGYFPKGDMVKEFEDAAFTMQPREVRMVKTKYGWHLIRVEARRQKEVRARHILAATEVQETDWEKALLLAQSLRQRVIEGERFYTLAKEHNSDAEQLYESPPFMDLNSLQPNVRKVLNGKMTQLPDTTFLLSEVVEVRPNGYLLVLEMERKPEAPLTYEEVRQQVLERLQQSKSIEAYVEKLREKTYIDIRFQKWTPNVAEF
jgi:peptidyl-prolyl cis-trans isomerase SurA